jgi:hypothetical protein
VLNGDAVFIVDKARGGDDVLTGGDHSGGEQLINYLIGDADDMYDRAKGGNDTLTGGDNASTGTSCKPS